ncbi:MAG: hypothetical protein ACKOQ7_07275 [Actinomycetota bacterium]
MQNLVATIDSGLMENAALGVSVGAVLVGLVLLKIISSIVGKVISSAAMVALALAGWSQRAEISDCAQAVKEQAVKEQAKPGATIEEQCTFFGQDVDIKVPIPQG